MTKGGQKCRRGNVKGSAGRSTPKKGCKNLDIKTACPGGRVLQGRKKKKSVWPG